LGSIKKLPCTEGSVYKAVAANSRSSLSKKNSLLQMLAVDSSSNTNCFYETIGSGPAVVGIFLSCYFFLQSFFLLGSTVWPKNALIKTFAAGVCIFVSYILIAVLCLKAILPNNFFMTEPYIDREASGGWLIFITSFFALFNWVLAYFRFKESEIINRW
jgi:hypothetical protein